MLQQVIIYILLCAALVYLGLKYIFPKKKKGNGDKNCDNCG